MKKIIFIELDEDVKTKEIEIHLVLKQEKDLSENRWINEEVENHGYFFCKCLIGSLRPVIRHSFIIDENYKVLPKFISKSLFADCMRWDYDKAHENIEELLRPKKEIDLGFLRTMKWGTVDTSRGFVNSDGVYIRHSSCQCEYCTMY